MVANITTGKDIYGALAYNQHKVDRGKGAVLATSNIREPDDGRFGVAALADELLRWMPSHVRTEKPVVHISLNPDPEDRLSDDELTDPIGGSPPRRGTTAGTRRGRDRTAATAASRRPPRRGC